MRVLTVVLLVVLGCGSPAPSGDPVELLTGWGTERRDAKEPHCLFWTVVGLLVVDPTYGTAIRVESGGTRPVMWFPGYTGRRVESEVVVLDSDGHVVATTGQRYFLGGGGPGDGAFLACDVIPQ